MESGPNDLPVLKKKLTTLNKFSIDQHSIRDEMRLSKILPSAEWRPTIERPQGGKKGSKSTWKQDGRKERIKLPNVRQISIPVYYHRERIRPEARHRVAPDNQLKRLRAQRKRSFAPTSTKQVKRHSTKTGRRPILRNIGCP